VSAQVRNENVLKRRLSDDVDSCGLSMDLIITEYSFIFLYLPRSPKVPRNLSGQRNLYEHLCALASCHIVLSDSERFQNTPIILL